MSTMKTVIGCLVISYFVIAILVLCLCHQGKNPGLAPVPFQASDDTTDVAPDVAPCDGDPPVDTPAGRELTDPLSTADSNHTLASDHVDSDNTSASNQTTKSTSSNALDEEKKPMQKRIICKLLTTTQQESHTQPQTHQQEQNERQNQEPQLDRQKQNQGTAEAMPSDLQSGSQTEATSATPATMSHTNANTDISDNTGHPNVTLANSTQFLQLLAAPYDANATNRSVPAQCVLTMFYASWCPFSARAAPHFNGLARVFPDLQLIAVDSYKYNVVNTQFGIMALPTLMLFHNGRAMHKFNGSEFNITHFTDYILAHTNLEKALEPEILKQDWEGPLPTTPVPVTDYYLYLSWMFGITVALGHFWKSAYCQRMLETLRNNWREAEIQHEHND